MKSIVVFYSDEKSRYADEKAFGGKSSKELSLKWAENFSESIFNIKSGQCENFSDLLNKISEICTKENADSVIYAYDDLPFLNKILTQEMLNAHYEYLAEYTLSDGYPYGFAPEIISSGTVKILYELSKSNPEGAKPVSRTSFFDLIKTDINSFEIETVMAPQDWRLLRLKFDCSTTDTFTASKKLYESGKYENPQDAAQAASNNPEVLKTVPGFYNLQITDFCPVQAIYYPYHKAYLEKNNIKADDLQVKKRFMSFENIKKIVNQIDSFSGFAVIGLSCWGEPLYHPDFLKIVDYILQFPGLSVFFETDGQAVTDELCTELKKITDKAEKRINGWPKLMCAVTLDAFSGETYSIIKNGSGNYENALAAVSKLKSALKENVYPQFVRMNENEKELEGFFRYWKNKENPSGGDLIIQKYDDFAGLLPECKPADLSPLERNVCWHLRRDMTILTNGDVPLCRECVLGGITGNVFEEGIPAVWQKFDEELKNHIAGNYSEKCRKCDEYYTFNF